MVFKYISILMIFSLLVQNGETFSCKYTGRAGCISSCKAQNCATGYCTPKLICVCTRCDKGAGWPPF